MRFGENPLRKRIACWKMQNEVSQSQHLTSKSGYHILQI
jgi:hypothetical protein